MVSWWWLRTFLFGMIGGTATLFWLILMLILRLTILKLLILLPVLRTGIALFLTKWSMLILWVILLMSWSPGELSLRIPHVGLFPARVTFRSSLPMLLFLIILPSPVSTSWKWIWTLKIPAKLKGFLWICMHGKLLTNHHLMIRGLVDDDICPYCNNARVDLKHLFGIIYLVFRCPKRTTWRSGGIGCIPTSTILVHNQGVIFLKCLLWLPCGKFS